MKKETTSRLPVAKKVEQFAVMIDNRQTPAKLYDTHEDAQNEAVRLATKERTTAFVLKVVTKVELTEVKITHL